MVCHARASFIARNVNAAVCNTNSNDGASQSPVKKEQNMTGSTTHHGTVVVEQTIGTPVARAYAAFADAKERESWGAPSDTAVFRYEECSFRVGGRDIAICGAKADPRFRVEARFDANGAVILLEDHDRSRWNLRQIADTSSVHAGRSSSSSAVATKPASRSTAPLRSPTLRPRPRTSECRLID
jgi:hypothetical protein